MKIFLFGAAMLAACSAGHAQDHAGRDMQNMPGWRQGPAATTFCRMSSGLRRETPSRRDCGKAAAWGWPCPPKAMAIPGRATCWRWPTSSGSAPSNARERRPVRRHARRGPAARCATARAGSRTQCDVQSNIAQRPKPVLEAHGAPGSVRAEAALKVTDLRTHLAMMRASSRQMRGGALRRGARARAAAQARTRPPPPLPETQARDAIER